MLESIENQQNFLDLSQKPQKQASQLKKKCLFKKKVEGASEKSKNDNIPDRYFNICNIHYFEMNAAPVEAENEPRFLEEIFNFNTISKVTKNRDRITLSLKLCPKMSKASLTKPSQNGLTESLKKCPFAELNISDEKSCFRINVEKLHNTLHQYYEVSRLKNQDENFNVSRYPSEEEINQNLEQKILNVQSKHYIIFENVFKPDLKRIKNIHFSNSLLELLGRFNENLVFELLENRSLPFQEFFFYFRILKKLDRKIYAENSLKHFTKLLESLYDENSSETHHNEESFSMSGIMEDKDKKEKAVNLKWTCSHPSIIVIEFFEEDNANKYSQIENGKEEEAEELDELEFIKI